MKGQKSFTRNREKLSYKDWTLFLDRDGVINKKIEGDYVRSWEQFAFLPESLDGLRGLSNLFKRLIIVTNQRGIARQVMTQNNLQNIHSKMLERLEKEGIRIDAIYTCPHDVLDRCGCRKPDIGLFIQAQRDFPDINFQKSIFLGDSPSDWEAAKRAGALAIGIGPSSIISENDNIPTYPNLKDYCRHLIEAKT